MEISFSGSGHGQHTVMYLVLVWIEDEKENFNWSCRTHRGEYSGEMWWCCSKEGKDAAGCLYAKHESKDEDEDEEDEKEKEAAEAEARAKQRCMCCKEIGHTIENCPRDPNIKTSSITLLSHPIIRAMPTILTPLSITLPCQAHPKNICMIIRRLPKV